MAKILVPRKRLYRSSAATKVHTPLQIDREVFLEKVMQLHAQHPVAATGDRDDQVPVK